MHIIDRKIALELWLIGMLGVIASSAFVLPQIFSKQELPVSIGAAIGISTMQSSVILALAVWIGSRLSKKVGLRSPVALAFANNDSIKSAFLPQLQPGIVGGIVSAAIMLVASFFLPEQLSNLNDLVEIPLIVKVLAGGITEEILLRWGVMTVLVWGLWRVFQKKHDAPNAHIIIFAIIISSLIFAISHLPIAAKVNEIPLTNYSIAFVLLLNSQFGLIAGFLYWRYGLESAIIAHVVTHIFSHSAGILLG